MHRISLITSALIVACHALTGCRANPSGRTPVVAMREIPTPVGDRGDAEPIDPKFVRWSRLDPLVSNTPIEAPIPLRFDFLAPNSPVGAEYAVVVAPLPGTIAPAHCQVASPPAVVPPPVVPEREPEGAEQPRLIPDGDVSYGMLQDMASNPDFRIFVGRGFAYMMGTRPHGETGKGEVTSDGTWMIVKADEAFDRFFLIHTDKGKKMTVKSLLAAVEPREVMTSLRYVDVMANGTIGPTKPIPTDPMNPIFQFLNQVIESGAAIGFPAPPNWPTGPPER